MASRAAFSFAGCLGTSRLQAGHVQGVNRVFVQRLACPKLPEAKC